MGRRLLFLLVALLSFFRDSAPQDQPAPAPTPGKRMPTFQRTTLPQHIQLRGHKPIHVPFKWGNVSAAIPRLIHQSWRRADLIPSKYASWISTWVQLHPTWKYVFWDDEDNDRFLNGTSWRSTYWRLEKPVARADFARYALMYQFGGVYADLDCECIRPFDDLTESFGFAGLEPDMHVRLQDAYRDGLLCNALLASAPRHPFWLSLMATIRRVVQVKKIANPVDLTGPLMMNVVYTALGRAETRITALPEEFFYPEVAMWHMKKLCSQPQRRRLPDCRTLAEYKGNYTNNTHAVHHWQCSWCPPPRRGPASPPPARAVSIADLVPPDQLVRPTAAGWLSTLPRM
eukprot:EG_transcript_10651